MKKQTKKKKVNNRGNKKFICPYCNSKMVFDTNYYCCSTCGFEE